MVTSFLGVRTDRQTDTVLESSHGNMSAHKKFLNSKLKISGINSYEETNLIIYVLLTFCLDKKNFLFQRKMSYTLQILFLPFFSLVPFFSFPQLESIQK